MGAGEKTKPGNKGSISGLIRLQTCDGTRNHFITSVTTGHLGRSEQRYFTANFLHVGFVRQLLSINLLSYPYLLSWELEARSAGLRYWRQCLSLNANSCVRFYTRHWYLFSSSINRPWCQNSLTYSLLPGRFVHLLRPDRRASVCVHVSDVFLCRSTSVINVVQWAKTWSTLWVLCVEMVTQMFEAAGQRKKLYLNLRERNVGALKADQYAVVKSWDKRHHRTITTQIGRSEPRWRELSLDELRDFFSFTESTPQCKTDDCFRQPGIYKGTTQNRKKKRL